MADVISIDLARARRELREVLGDNAEHVLAEIRLILADAERDRWTLAPGGSHGR